MKKWIMSNCRILILTTIIVFVGGCEKSCEKNSPWLNADLKYKCVKDKEGNSYATIKIGEQTWMAENLRTSVYANGDPIPNVKDNQEWDNLSTGAWTHYENNSLYEEPYGKLYNWYSIADPRNVCPSGWHVPSEAEWKTLINSVEANAEITNSSTNNSGVKLKSMEYWEMSFVQIENTTNESGFSAIPGGCRYNQSPFYPINQSGVFWSSTEESNNAKAFGFFNWDQSVFLGSNDKHYGLSIRCLKD